IWMCVHNIDVEEAWYPTTNELTHRPWIGELPYKCSEPTGGMVVAHTEFNLADGSVLRGFSSPPFPPDGKKGFALSYRQPQLFLPDGTLIGFWLGIRKSSVEQRQRLYTYLGKNASQVFPMK